VSLFDQLRNFLRGAPPAPPPSTLRNKPGGLARVRFPQDHRDGSYDMQGCFVTTVRLDRDSFWVIEPPLQFTVRAFMLTGSGRIACPGDPATVDCMHDDLLEPIRDIGEDERDESGDWLPAVPAAESELIEISNGWANLSWVDKQ